MFDQKTDSPKKRRWEVLAMIKSHPLITGIVALLVIAGLIFVLRTSQATTTQPDKAKEEKKEEKKQPFEVAVVKNGSISSSLITTATLDPDSQVTLASETNGIVDRILVEEGDRVRQGQIIATLSANEKIAALKKAEVHLQNATNELKRKQTSYDEKLISQVEYDKARYDKEVAQAEVNVAQVEVARTTIRAPFSGIVTQRFIEKGQNINAQTQLFTIVDFEPLEAKIYLPEREIYGLRSKQDVNLTLNAQKDVNFTGRITQINPAVDTKTGTVKVTVEVNNPPAQVRPGSFVDVRLVTQRHDNALLVPKKALAEEAGEQFVFVIKKGVASRQRVETGFLDDRNAEILSGLKQGDEVVVAGQGSLREGSKTEIVAKRQR